MTFENLSVKSMIMKKSILILLVGGLVFFTNDLNSQVVAIGIKGGLNSARLSGFDGNSRISGHGGLFLHHTINNNWCFQPELIFSGEGQKYFLDGEERTIALDYISVPLMIQYYATKQLYFEAGPQIGILASAQDKGINTDHFNVKDDYTPAQVGINLGLGVYVTPKFGIYGRYHFGLTDVSRFDNIVDHSLVGQLGVAVRLQ